MKTCIRILIALGLLALQFGCSKDTPTQSKPPEEEQDNFPKAIDFTLSDADGKSYTAATTIPDITRRIDSVWWEPVEDPDDSTLAKLIVRATDPAGFGNYIRYFTKTNEGPFLPGFNSVFDDQVIDGTTYTFPVDRGFDKNLDPSDYEPFFNRGDTVTVKVADIDKVTYDFWRTLEFSYQSVGNPFSNPVKVLGNISNGALGYFGGYAAQYHRLVIPQQ